MRIDELTITNFKCFENETFRFNPHFNVVIGKNASGKSSLLDALAIAASSYLSGIDENFAKRVQPNEIRTVLIDGQPRKQAPVDIHVKGFINDKNIEWLPQINNEPPDKRRGMSIGGSGTIVDWARLELLESRKNNTRIKFPLIIYYGTLRLWKQQENISYLKQDEGVFVAYSDCLNPKSSSDVFLSWYKTYEDTINKFQQPEHILFLKLFRDTISSMVPEWTDMAYNFLEDDLMGIFKSENGQINMLPFKNLSDGYRNMIGMVADMVYRCIQLNPGLKENAVKETKGIVLIDELDLHLHPEWQRRVVGDLKRIFPKVQFVVTTHSPFIIQETEEGELIKMSDGKIVTTGGANEYSLEDVAEYIQDVKDPAWSNKKVEMYNAAKKYFALLNELQPGKGNGELNKIREELNILGKPYSDNVAYTAFLEQKRFLAEQNLGQ